MSIKQYIEEKFQVTESGTEVFDSLFPKSNIVFLSNAKFFRGNERANRFFPLSKKDFDKLDHSKIEIYQKIDNKYIKIN